MLSQRSSTFSAAEFETRREFRVLAKEIQFLTRSKETHGIGVLRRKKEKQREEKIARADGVHIVRVKV